MNRYLRFCIPLIIFLLCAGSFSSMAQPGYWVQSAGGVTPDEGADISIDSLGNTYTAGYFTGNASFGSFSINAYGIADIFLSKTDSLGVFEWVVKAGGIGSDRAHAIKTDPAGNSYVTGYYYGTATFGSQSITSLGVQDIFIAKYDNTGSLVWVKSAGGADADIGNGINIDPSGNVFITGEFTGTATFGAFSLTSLNNSVDVFTAKLDEDGNFLWAKKGSAPFIDRGLDIACDAGGNSYVTGQFTDTITFDVIHNNNMYNGIFVVKYNSNGEEQWFRKIGGGSMNVVGGIAVDENDNVYLTGDFTGDVIFFGTTNTTLSNTYANRIFLAKYNSSGDLLWTEADGSSSEISSKNLALDEDGNPCIVGNFKCRLNEYADAYGQGTFNSVGFWDIFVSKYNANGVWQFSRSYGGKQNEYGAGIVLSRYGQIHTTGSFFQQVVFPLPSNFIGYEAQPVFSGNLYCGELFYQVFRGLTSAGNSDILINKIVDPARAPYDYYRRPLSGCVQDYKGVCINGNVNACPDSVIYCGQGTLSAFSFTNPAGPAFTYDWAPGGTGNFNPVTSSGYYAVTQSSVDGCFVSTDSIYVTGYPFPPMPVISDNFGINTNAINPEDILMCEPDSVLLTGGGFGSNLHGWDGPGTISSPTSTVWASTDGFYVFSYTDSNGCPRMNTIVVDVDEDFDPIVPDMVCLDDPDLNDSIIVCEGSGFRMFVYDPITNPDTLANCILSAVILWDVSPDTVYYTGSTECPQYFNFLQPESTGDYLIEAWVIRINRCDTDTMYISHSMYVEVVPIPDVDSVSVSLTLVGSPALCPGDSVLLIASAAPNYLWSGPGAVSGSTNDSVWAFQPGLYKVVTSVSDTNSYGCIAIAIDTATQIIAPNLQPTIIMNPASGLMCPNDSVRLQCSGSGIFQWYGPSGPIGGNIAFMYVNTPGIYFCVRTDGNGCAMLSNSVEVNQYATPFLLVTPDAALCAGDSAEIMVITNPGSLIQWQSPLSGNSLTQMVHQPGIYTCMVTSCGIQTEAGVTISELVIAATITADDSLHFCDGDSVRLFANSGPYTFWWEPVNSSDTAITVFDEGTYTLSVEDSSGCTGSTSITVTITPDTIAPALSLNPGSVLCNNDSIIITAIANPGSPIAWQSPLSGNTVSQVISSPGTYTCIITTCGVPVTESVTVTASTLTAVIESTGELAACEGDSVGLYSAEPAAQYNWLLAGNPGIISDSSFIYAVETGDYILSVTDSNGCIAGDTTGVLIYPDTLTAPVVQDTVICSGEYVVLEAQGTGSISWFDAASGTIPVASGNTFTTPILSNETIYYVIAADEYCKTDYVPVTISVSDCELVTAPNVFSPNNDGLNDLFIFTLSGAKCFNCSIYNRWGRLLYEWSDPAQGWDGTNMRTGTLVNEGVYYYVLTWCDNNDAEKREAGFIQLLR